MVLDFPDPLGPTMAEKDCHAEQSKRWSAKEEAFVKGREARDASSKQTREGKRRGRTLWKGPISCLPA